MLAATKLLPQHVCRDKLTFTTTKQAFVTTKHAFVATKLLYAVVVTEIFCRDKSFVVASLFLS